MNVEIYVSEIPQTTQKQPEKKLPPRRPGGAFTIATEEAELPDEIALEELAGASSQEMIAGVPVEVPPRPILEVYPDVSGISCKGYVRLLLLVNKNGRIESIEVVENTTGASKCLTLAKQAARQSRWLPAKVENKPVSSWISKIYKFNIDH